MEQAKATARMVQIAGRHYPNLANCLSQSLTIWWLLRRQGIRSDLRIGVWPLEHHLEAHAWVEWQGIPLTDDSDVTQRFAPFLEAIAPKNSRRYL